MRELSSILQKQDYGHRDAQANDRPSRWLEAAGLLLFALAGLGERKAFNSAFGALPKAITLGIVALTLLCLLLRGDTGRLQSLRPPARIYLAYLLGLLLISLWIWLCRFTGFSSISRGAQKLLFQLAAALVAVSAAYLYGRRAIDVFVCGICAANALIMLMEVPAFGVGPSLKSLLDNLLSLGGNTYGYAAQLEIHEITFLYALFIVYYLFYADRRTPRQRRRNRVLVCLSLLFFLAGMKRIMLPALAVSLLYVWLVRKLPHPGRAAIATGIVWFLFFFVYLYAVYNGQLVALLNRLGINTMGREYIWQLTRPYYTLSPTYLGLGFEAVDGLVTRFYQLGLIDQAYPLHNDILKVFVELGFPGLCFWGGLLYIVLPVFWYKRYGDEAALLYMALMNPITITYLTDNTAFYFWCTICLRLLPMAHVCCAPKEARKP